jgi:hypothetical protein
MCDAYGWADPGAVIDEIAALLRRARERHASADRRRAAIIFDQLTRWMTDHRKALRAAARLVALPARDAEPSGSRALGQECRSLRWLVGEVRANLGEHRVGGPHVVLGLVGADRDHGAVRLVG